ncbi:hypothetical protein C8R45DRAFT_1213111 [Mycena sanguinolenta]|nr:hypothetical protein C8R45DRAFT_1213111 [Mycena sanguinolenta]
MLFTPRAHARSRPPKAPTGMFSRSYHHHQDATGAAPPPTAPLSSWSPRPDLHSTHHNRLECLLDSALATLALLHEPHYYASTPLTFSAHVAEVLLALNRYILIDPTTAGLAPLSPSPEPTTNEAMPTGTPATYAATADPARAKSMTPDANTNTHPVTPSSRATIPIPSTAGSRTTANDRKKQRASRLIIRFDTNLPAPKRVDVRTLYNAIAKELLEYGASQLAGVQWTRKGNLVVHARPGVGSPKLLLTQDGEIWKAIRPVLGFPVKYKPLKFEVDEPWYSVVLHGAPMPPSRDPADITLTDIQFWLDYGVSESAGTAMAHSVLCTTADFQTRDSLTICMALSSEADALRLIEDGCTLWGARCRVSRYVPSQQQRVPRDAPAPHLPNAARAHAPPHTIP